MRETGTVVAIANGRARVEIDSRAPTCCSCCNQGASCKTLDVDAPSGLKTGDKVTLEVPGGPVVRNLLMLLVVPAALVVGGVALGYALIAAPPGEINMPAVLIGVALMFGWYIGAHLLDRKRPRSPQSAPRIIDISTNDSLPRP